MIHNHQDSSNLYEFSSNLKLISLSKIKRSGWEDHLQIIVSRIDWKPLVVIDNWNSNTNQISKIS